MANPVVGIDVRARLDAFRAELAKIPDIGAKEARALTTQLSREIKKQERAAKRAADASKKTKGEQKSLGQQLVTSFGEAKTAIAVAGGAVVAFGAAAAAGLARAIAEVVELSSELNGLEKQAGAVGVAVEDFDRLSGALALLTEDGVNATQAIQDFQRRTGEAVPDLVALADEIAAMENPAERTARAMELFGEESGRKLAGALAVGGDAVRAAMDEIEAAGVVTTEQAAAAAMLQDEITVLTRSLDTMRREALVPLMPAFAAVSEGLAQVAQNEALLGDVGKVAKGLADTFVIAVVPALAAGGAALDNVIAQMLILADATEAAAKTAMALGFAQTGNFKAAGKTLVDAGGAALEAGAGMVTLQADIARNRAEWARWSDGVQRAYQRAQKAIGAVDIAPGAPTGGGGAGKAGDAGKSSEADKMKQLEERIQAAAAAYGALAKSAVDAQVAQLDGVQSVVAQREIALAQLEQQRAVALEMATGSATEGLAIEQAYQAGRIAIIADATEQIDAIEQAAHEERLQRIQAAADAQVNAVQMTLKATASLAGQLSGVFYSIASAQATAAEEGGEAQLKEARDWWYASQAMAIMEAGVNIPLAMSNALTSGSKINPVFGLAMMAAAGVSAGVAFGAVIAQTAGGPPFHAGGLVAGMAPDERQATLLTGEAVMPRDAVRRIGEERTREIIRGEDRGGEVVVVNSFGHRVLDVQAHQAMRLRRGSLWTAVRSTQPRSGLHSPWRR